MTNTPEHLPDAEFTQPQYSPQQLEAAARIHDYFLHVARNQDDLNVEPHEEMRKHPDFALAHAALGSRLVFMFPSQTYGNDEFDPSTTLESPIGELCVSILDPSPTANHDLYAWEMLLNELSEAGLEAADEYHFEFKDRSQTVRQAVQCLLDLGLSYNPDVVVEEGCECIFRDELIDRVPQRRSPSTRSPSP